MAVKRSRQPKPDAQKNKGGRPSDYLPAYAEQAYRYALLGATDAKLAEFFGVSEQTINAWKARHPKFLESIKKGKEQADAEISKSLFHRAKGYSHPDVVITQYEGVITKTPVVKNYPPDTTACIFWLKNRQREAWRDVQRLEHTGKDGMPLESVSASVTELHAELAKRGALLPSCVAIPIKHA